MASPKAVTNTNEYLPEDIIVQILYRLPVKPLIRFRCVSKRWSSIVLDPQFAKSQFKFASERKTLNHRLLFSTSSELESFDLQTPSFPDDSSLRNLTCPFKQQGSAVKFMGSCNGMVFVVACDFHDTYYIWNPTTGLLLKLPNSSNGVAPISGLPHCGFGYVSATDDYKVVVFDHFRYVDMYSSKANSWKRIESQPHFSSLEYFTDSKGAFSNEALHWLDPADKPTIIAFDLVKEKFRKMALPLLKEDDETSGFFSDMGVVNVAGGCLCVASYDGDGYYCSDYIQVWVMMDYDVCESWTKWIKFVDEEERLPPLVFWERSIVMVLEDKEKEYPEWIQELLRFDHKEDKLDKVAVCSGRYRLEWGDFDMIEYDESLLWLHAYQGAEGR